MKIFEIFFNFVFVTNNSYLVKIWIIVKSKHNGNIEQRVVIAHVDYADFCTSGENSEKKMQEIVSCYMKMHKAARGKV